MKKILITILAVSLITASGCKKFLDVNDNPNAPQTVEANLYLSPMLHWMASGQHLDGVYMGRYTQMWAHITPTEEARWENHGHPQKTSGPDQGGQIWRDVYWSLGQNLIDMNTKAEAEQRWDLLGVGQILKAWGWLFATDANGEIIVKEAIKTEQTLFNYDTQEFTYQEILRLLNEAIVNLNKTDGAVNAGYLGKTDIIYKGNRVAWLKFANGLKAITLNHYSNKTGLYKPDDVIAAVNASFTSAADDALITYTGTANDDINVLAGIRNNHTSLRQSRFILGLMDGTQFGGVVDPRMSRMLAPSPDGLYRGLESTQGVGALTAAQQPLNFWGYTTQAAAIRTPARYLFSTKTRMPLMTYSQLQFVKAEAAFKKNDRATALTAYTAGVSSHVDFVNARNSDDGQTPTQISALEKSTFLASPAVIPSAANLTLSHIMSQKYIAQWAWAQVETWMDLRRYSYTALDPATGGQVFRGFNLPITFFADNQNKPVQRMRPRYNSEYIWNVPSLEKIGGLAVDYQTKPMWITTP